MKILMISGTFPPRKFGGVTAVSYNLAKRLVQRGYEVTVYTTDVGNDSRSRLDVRDSKVIDGIDVRHFRNISNSPAFKHRLYSPIGLIMTTKKELRSFDIIHLHDFRSFQNLIILHYAKKHGIPYVLQAHGSVLPFFQKQRLKRIFDLIFGYNILKNASKVIAVTKAEVEQYRKMGVDENKIVIVPNGIDLSEYDNLPERGEFRKKHGISDIEKMILYLGRIHRTKDIDLLVKTFADVSKELDNVRLVLVGPDDGYQSALKELIQALKVHDKVLFTGFVTNDEKMAAFVDADVFVNPRADEIFGLVFLEANACGTPVICSKGCGIANVIDGKTGFAVHNDKDQLRDAIFKILTNVELRHHFGEGGKKLVREKFSWDIVVEQLEKIYGDVKGCREVKVKI